MMMARRRLSPREAAYPLPPDFVDSIVAWREDAIALLMGYVWLGTEALVAELQIDLSQDYENFERDLNEMVAERIRDQMSERPPFYLEHHPFENENRSSPPAVPKAPDLAFILRANPRASLPIEAKVLDSDGAVAEYVKEITDNFLECRYAPFSSHGGMLGYLRSGTVANALVSIQGALKCTLVAVPALARWQHHTSAHRRVSRKCDGHPLDFVCHHLIVLLRQSTPA
jgi:hypothetical protein